MVTRALALSRAFAVAARLDRDGAERLALVVEEWLNNVLDYGQVSPSARIAIRLQRQDRLLRLTISDPGRAFDPRAVSFEGPNLDRGGGAGLALIKAWCRIAGYRRARGRNRLVFELVLA